RGTGPCNLRVRIRSRNSGCSAPIVTSAGVIVAMFERLGVQLPWGKTSSCVMMHQCTRFKLSSDPNIEVGAVSRLGGRGQDFLRDDYMDAPVSVRNLGDAEIGCGGEHRDRSILVQIPA